MASAASSAAPGNPELLFENVLRNLELKSRECPKYGDDEQGVEQSVGQGGGAGPEISIEDITVLIILFHGSTELTEEVVKKFINQIKKVNRKTPESMLNLFNLNINYRLYESGCQYFSI